MGMYTKLDLTVSLKADTPSVIIKTLYLMCSYEDDRFDKLDTLELNHPFFKTERWRWMFRGVGSMNKDHRNPDFQKDEKSGLYNLSVSFDIKNYTDEIELFLQWIQDYISSKPKQIGTYEYEEDSEESIIVWTGSKIEITSSATLRSIIQDSYLLLQRK